MALVYIAKQAILRFGWKQEHSADPAVRNRCVRLAFYSILVLERFRQRDLKCVLEILWKTTKQLLAASRWATTIAFYWGKL